MPGCRTLLYLLIAWSIPWHVGAAGDDTPVSVSSAGQGPRIALSAEMELMAGLWRRPYDTMALPMGTYLQLEGHTRHRAAGIVGQLALGADPLALDAEAALLGLEVFHTGIRQRLDLRFGRMNMVHGGRFRFVDGASARVRLVDHLHLSAWGGAAWHPESAGLLSGGATWGTELALRSPSPLGGALRYDHVDGEGLRDVDRVGADVTLHLPRAAGFGAEARVDFVPAWKVVELLSVAAEVRPHHRLHLRLEGGGTHPVADALGRGGSIYSSFYGGPTVYLDARLRAGLPPGMLTLDLGTVADPAAEDGQLPGVRMSVAGSNHPGRPWRYVIRGSVLHGPGGEAALALAQVGRRLGPIDVQLLAEQALFRHSGRTWRAATHLGAQLSVHAGDALDLSLTGQLDMGRGPRPEGQLLVVATIRWRNGPERGPAPDRDRFLSPYSPHSWQREHLPRSPGTVPGSDPYPSVPQGAEADDAR